MVLNAVILYLLRSVLGPILRTVENYADVDMRKLRLREFK